MDEKLESIHEKGFDLYNKIKINRRTLEDAVVSLEALPYGTLRHGDKRLTDKRLIMKALAENNGELLREISNYFYRTSGIYQKVCNYFATMYRYDWFLVPEIYEEEAKPETILKDFNNLLTFLDNTHIAKMCGDIALKVVKNGAYYGYLVAANDKVVMQELPIKYCRTIYNLGDLPVIEFNMKFFDDKFPNTAYRNKILKLWPKEFQQGYALYKRGLLIDDAMPYRGCWSAERNGWYALDPQATIKFCFANSNDGDDLPLFINAIPAILDLDEVEALDRKRQMQQLIKILIQKLPTDKNGDLVFDVDEAADIHANAVAMLRHTVGVDVLTTFADVQDVDLSDTSEASGDAVKNATDNVYRAMGISENLFDTDGNLALDKSMLIDEGAARTLLLQFNIFWDRIVQLKNKRPKRYKFRLYMLETTQNNYKELSDKYKAQVQLGYSKILPQVALGHSQSSILNTAYFENQVLNLSALMLPPLQSSVMNAETLQALGNQQQKVDAAAQGNTDGSGAGRPEKPDSEKSEKTIANQESLS